MRTGRPTFPIAALVMSIALLAACGQEDDTGDDADPGGGSTPEQTTSEPTTTEPSATTAPTAVPQSAIDQSIAMLAEQLAVSPAQIEVARAIEVTWRDGSIGCAKKDQGYTQALVDGALIELVVAGKTYAFHQGDGAAPFYCAHPTDPVPES